MAKKIVYVASSSFGKDSCAMLINIIEKGLPLDDIVFFDTGNEFNAIYSVINWFRLHLKNIGSKLSITVLGMNETYEQLMFEHKVSKKDGTIQEGYSWCGGRCRWMTSYKLQYLNRYYKEKYPDCVICEYVGIAADESTRIDRSIKYPTIKLYPLVEWKMKEADCLKMCYDYGIQWLENGINLYDILDRVSCKFCGNKNLSELRNLYNNCPDYWEELKATQCKTNRLYKGVGVDALEQRFIRENKIMEQQFVPAFDIFEMI